MGLYRDHRVYEGIIWDYRVYKGIIWDYREWVYVGIILYIMALHRDCRVHNGFI